MKKTILITASLLSLGSIGQTLNYYSTANGLSGTALKTALHDIIDDHTELEYGTIKTVIRQADEDPNNSNNVILMYTGNSIGKWDFASDPSNPDHNDYWNREHVWAKSHGDFGPDGIYTERGANTDAHHLRPVDMTINSARGYKDFDNGGTIVNNGSTPTQCKSTTNTWEPRDEVKGDVARMIFYMATRYEGGVSLAGDNEPDLEVVNSVGTFPLPQMGKLSTLLAWHMNDPVDAFELRRNDVIFKWQGNRNPYIDHPEFVEMVFGTTSALPDQFSNLAINPIAPTQGNIINVSVDLLGTPSTPTLFWGENWTEVLDSTNSIVMTDNSGGNYTADIPSQVYSADVIFRIKNGNSAHISHNFQIQPEPFSGTITSIRSIQGNGPLSPLAWEITDASGTVTNSANDVEVSVTGIVTGAFGDNFFIQESDSLRSGIYIYSSGFFPTQGDSVIVTGKIKEYYNMTEIVNASAMNVVATGLPMPSFKIVSAQNISDSNPNSAENYESLLVKVFNAGCSDTDLGFGMWELTDASGSCNVHNSASYTYSPTLNNAYNVSGVLNFSFDKFKIELRNADDVEAGSDNLSPKIVSASNPTSGIVAVVFSEGITNDSRSDVLNYSINNGVDIVAAVPHSLQANKVNLHVQNINSGVYTLVVNGCEDQSGNVMNDTIDFTNNINNVSIDEFGNSNIRVWSNESSIYVSGLENNTAVNIVDVNGKTIFTGSKNADFVVNVVSGVYFIELKQGSITKVIKQQIN